MEPYIQISKINDFLYCPMSLYLHGMYEGFSQKTYHAKPQVVGKLRHEAIDEGNYSTASRFIVGLEVYSQTYEIMGKIDMYDTQTKTLIERKTRIKRIFEGYIYQLYAQYFCLEEMGYQVKRLVLRSLEDNKNYEVKIPTEAEKRRFEGVLNAIKNFDPTALLSHRCPKCEQSIYGALSW